MGAGALSQNFVLHLTLIFIILWTLRAEDNTNITELNTVHVSEMQPVKIFVTRSVIHLPVRLTSQPAIIVSRQPVDQQNVQNLDQILLCQT